MFISIEVNNRKSELADTQNETDVTFLFILYGQCICT